MPIRPDIQALARTATRAGLLGLVLCAGLGGAWYAAVRSVAL